MTGMLQVFQITLLCSNLVQNQGKDDWEKASRLYLQSAASGTPEQLVKNIQTIAQENTKRSVALLLKPINSVGINKYWIIIAGLARLTSDEAIDAIGEEVVTGKTPEVRRDLIMALRLSRSARTLQVLQRVLKEGTLDLQVSAIDELVDKGDRTAAPLMIELAEKDTSVEKEITRRIFRGLKSLAMEPPPNSPSEWRAWWNAKGESPSTQAPNLSLSPGSVGQTVTESLRPTRSTEFEDLKRGLKTDVMVVEGISDKVEDVLTKLEIPNSVIGRELIQQRAGLSLSKCIALFINCGTSDWPPQHIQALRDFVSQGGYLFVTDLGVLQVARKAFPGYYDAGKGTHGDHKVGIVPWRGSTGHPLLRGVDLPIGSAQNSQPAINGLEWIIDSGGPVFSFDPKKTVTLIDAPDLLMKKKSSALAVTFSYGGDDKLIQQGVESGGVYEDFPKLSGGRVLCVLSHFSKQQQNEDGFALKNLLINFLIEAKDRKLLRDYKVEANKKR